MLDSRAISIKCVCGIDLYVVLEYGEYVALYMIRVTRVVEGRMEEWHLSDC